MRSPIARSALFSMVVHAALLVPIGLGKLGTLAQTDVIRGVSSIELEFWAPEPVSPEAGEELPSKPVVPQEMLMSDDGALSEERPLFLKNPAPRYPWIARINGWEGTVLIQAGVDPQGQAESVQVARSSGFSVLDGAARMALKQWKFLPARTRGGEAVASSVEVPITFRLEREE